MGNKQNQQNPPLSKKKRVDSKGNSARRIFAGVESKTVRSSTQLAIMPSSNAADIFIQKIKENAEFLGGRTVGKLFHTP